MATDNKNNIIESMKLAGKSLGLFATITGGIVAITFSLTEDRIIENERQALLRNLHMLIKPAMHDNDLYADTLVLNDKKLAYRNKPFTIYRARKNNKPVAAIFSVTAPDGYSGAIKMLVAIKTDNTLAGVRVINHHETPGLGDAIDIEKSDWIKIFDGKSLNNPEESRWFVKKDGGDFDQLTGATITPRAVVKMTKKTLQFYQSHHDIVFVESTTGEPNGRD